MRVYPEDRRVRSWVATWRIFCLSVLRLSEFFAEQRKLLLEGLVLGSQVLGDASFGPEGVELLLYQGISDLIPIFELWGLS